MICIPIGMMSDYTLSLLVRALVSLNLDSIVQNFKANFPTTCNFFQKYLSTNLVYIDNSFM
jgi:hypothetical protein